MKYVTAFGGKTLHDGTNRFSVDKLAPTRKAKIEKIRMASGLLFDPNYGTGSQVTPEPFSASFFMKFATKAAAEAEEDALDALVGTHATVTVNKDSGGAAETCGASLASISVVYKKNDFAFLVTLNLEPFNDFS